jgi:hypothetical protein
MKTEVILHWDSATLVSMVVIVIAALSICIEVSR